MAQPLPYNGVSSVPPERQASPLLASNNPFRNRALSPANPAPVPSTNPFLDEPDSLSPQSAPGASVMSPLQPVRPVQPAPSQDPLGNTRDLFDNLTINPSNGHRPAPPRPDNASKSRPSTARPDRSDRSDRYDRPSRSARPDKDRSSRREKDPLDVFADPPPLTKSATTTNGRARERRPRRNSESSIMERSKPDSDEDRRRRERRRRERDARHRDGKSSRSKKGAHMDIIDKLDVTGIYGTGMFHHDGPFDACNPNRNRKGVRTAPLQAFPKDSTNMALGGTGPVNKNIDLDLFHGRNPEGYNDFASTGTAPDSVGRSAEGVNFDPTTRIEPVHGPSSMGLGTSTFLDGAPASRSAMQRRTSENDQTLGNGGGGLQRKKSLAQRIRGGINRAPSGRVVSPEGAYPGPAQRAVERNVASPDSDDAVEKKHVRIAGDEMRADPVGGRVRSASSPKQSTSFNERSLSAFDDNKPAGGGFLNRMKSLRKPQPKRRVSEE